MSASNGNDRLAGLKGLPSKFKGTGFEVFLRPISFDERNELLAWMDENKGTKNYHMEIVRRVTALALCDEAGEKLCKPEEVGSLDPDKVDEIAMEAGARCGLLKRDDEKKAMPPDSSTTPTSSGPATSPSPVG